MHSSSLIHCKNCDNAFRTYQCADWEEDPEMRCCACRNAAARRDEYYTELNHTCPKCGEVAVHLVPEGSMLEDIRKACRETEPNDQDTFWSKLDRKWWWAENESVAIMILNTLTIYGDEAGMMTYVEDFLDIIQKGERIDDYDD